MEALTTMSLVIYLAGCVAAFGLIKFADKHNNKITSLGEVFAWTLMSWALVYILAIMLAIVKLADWLGITLPKELK